MQEKYFSKWVDMYIGLTRVPVVRAGTDLTFGQICNYVQDPIRGPNTNAPFGTTVLPTKAYIWLHFGLTWSNSSTPDTFYQRGRPELVVELKKLALQLNEHTFIIQ
jgi:hypothetical protein